MMKKVLLTGAALFAFATAANAVVLFSDNFDGNAPGPGAPSGWTVTTGTVDVVHTYGSAGNLQVDMDNASPTVATMESVAGIDLLAGNIYKISFDYGSLSSGVEILTVALGSFGSGVINFSPIATMSNSAFTFSVVSDILDAKLIFSSFLFSSNQGMMLDNVNVEQLTAIPLPPAVLLLGTGLMGLGALGRRRKV